MCVPKWCALPTTNMQEKERLAKQAAEEEGDVDEERVPKTGAGKKSKGPQVGSSLCRLMTALSFVR